MSKKRTSAESNNDKGGEVPGLNAENYTKRAKLVLRDTTLQDLPIELIENILVKAVAMEVEDMMLNKSVWKDKADLVISRLCFVCEQWSHILTTDFFRNELHRTLDRTAQKTIRLDILRTTPQGLFTPKIATLKDEIFVLWWVGVLEVYDRNDLSKTNNVIKLGILGFDCLASCSLYSCLYSLKGNKVDYISIIRITKDDKLQFTISPLVCDMYLPSHKPTLSVSANGSLIVVAKQIDKLPAVCVLNPDGTVQRKIKLPASIPKYADVFVQPKFNGNFLVTYYHEDAAAQLLEVNLVGQVLGSYKFSVNTRQHGAVVEVSPRGHMLACNDLSNAELIDSDLNVLHVFPPIHDNLKRHKVVQLVFNRERNELVAFLTENGRQEGVLAILCFVKE